MENETGRRIRDLLQRGGLNNVALASQIGLDESKLSKSISGVRSFSASELAKISDVLNVDLYWLTTGVAHRNSMRVAYRHDYDHASGGHVPPPGTHRRELESVANAYRQADLPSGRLLGNFRDQVVSKHWTASGGNQWAALRPISRHVASLWNAFLSEGHDPVLDVGKFVEREFGIDLVLIGSDVSHRARSYALEVKGSPVIVVGATAAWYSAIYGVFHELAHHLLDDLFVEGEAGSERASDIEQYANGFAGDVLMPISEMRSATVGTLTDSSFPRWLWEHGVGVESFRIRCEMTQTPYPAGVGIEQPAVNQAWLDSYGDLAAQRIVYWKASSFPQRLVDRHRELVDLRDVPADTLAWMLSLPIEDVERPSRIELDSDAQELMRQLGLDA